MTQPEAPQDVIADALLKQPLEVRGSFLRGLLAYAAAGLVVIEGKRPTCDALDRIADAIVRGQP